MKNSILDILICQFLTHSPIPPGSSRTPKSFSHIITEFQILKEIDGMRRHFQTGTIHVSRAGLVVIVLGKNSGIPVRTQYLGSRKLRDHVPRCEVRFENRFMLHRNVDSTRFLQKTKTGDSIGKT